MSGRMTGLAAMMNGDRLHLTEPVHHDLAVDLYTPIKDLGGASVKTFVGSWLGIGETLMNFILVDDAAASRSVSVAAPVSKPEQGRRIRQMSDAVSAMSATKTVQQSTGKSDRRWALRKPSEMPGYIGHSKNPQGVRCIVRNTSSSGALVEVCAGSDRFANPADGVPDQFTLVFISYKERSEVACAVMRRTGRMLGVRYIGPFRSFPAPQSTLKSAPAAKKR